MYIRHGLEWAIMAHLASLAASSEAAKYGSFISTGLGILTSHSLVWAIALHVANIAASRAACDAASIDDEASAEEDLISPANSFRRATIEGFSQNARFDGESSFLL